jgi:hypothetical protein
MRKRLNGIIRRIKEDLLSSFGVGFESVVVKFESTADGIVVVSELSEGVVTLPTTERNN